MAAGYIQRTLLTLALTVLALNWTLPTALATTICVNQGGAGGCHGTIVAALIAASNGDTIVIAGAASPYFEHLTIDKSVSLIGENPTNTIIDGGLSGQVIRISTPVTVTLTNLTIRNGQSGNDSFDQYGGGIHNVSGTLTLNNIVVSGNRSGSGVFAADGGGISNFFGTLTLNHSIVSGNITGTPLNGTSSIANGGNGGGIANQSGTLTVNDSTISGNRTGDGASGSSSGVGGNGGNGGGIYNGELGTVTVNRSTISGNSTGIAGMGSTTNGISGSGAGIYILGVSFVGDITVVTINTSTISGNRTGGGFQSSNGGDGGGIFVRQKSTVNVSDTTLAFNQMDGDQFPGGGGIANRSGTVNVKNTLLAFNHGPSGLDALHDCSGAVISQGYNLMMEPDCTITPTTGDQFYVRGSILGPLQNNGGPTQTHALVRHSPAIDAADSSTCPRTDQRGFVRPAFGGTSLRCDVGAFEFHDSSTFFPVLFLLL
jgi:hypothetical protein